MNTLAFAIAPLALLVPNVAGSPAVPANGLFIAQFDHIMGTSLDMKIVAGSVTVAHQAEQMILTEIARLDAILSSYQIDSEFNQWLKAPINQAISVSDDLFAVLSQFDHWQQRTGGAINAAAEHVSQLWQQAAHHIAVPTEAELQQVVAAANQTHWQLDPDKQTATRRTHVPLRLNTFTKSYVLDRAADVALTISGVDGVVLNGGGDIVVRGNWLESVSVVNPHLDAENGKPIARLLVKNGVVATSGDYRRGWPFGNEWVSHIMDPRTGLPAQHIISATVLHPDAVTAGALATAFNVLAPSESVLLATHLPGTEYLLVTRNGQTMTSPNWPGLRLPLTDNNHTLGRADLPTTSAYLLAVPTRDKLWNSNQELLITIELARFEGRSHRPFVAVWIEDETGKLVRQVALWYNKSRWLHELHEWYSLRVDTGVVASSSSATRSPGQYTLVWDGKDDQNQYVKQGKYTIMIETAREHGTHQLIRQVMDFMGKTHQQTLNGNVEIQSATLDYREKSGTR